ncbi:cyclase family protein [Acidaminobacter hydrogenoformans]|uniref:Kynurenine formamidase n=1 Tax=Acidaminobacter hydrogenoformans DSM 2784 TaxID=1120920 RepID=A0A1G5S4T7_9FIRM|nr:cyclase family protein [Acidaminobacter hydrogenoformans]SCZ80529.1 Kynurenine formamidase [Acidaminobacter hydrogenoformans DSM 2784]
MRQLKLIDLSQEIFQGMSVFPMHQPTFIMTNMTHEENMNQTGSKALGFSARNILISEHGGTHCDAVWEYKPSGATIDKMPMSHFWGSAICIDLSHIRFDRYIEPKDLELAVKKSGQEILKGDIVLMYTGHFDRNFGTDKWQTEYTGLSYEAAKWLAERGVVNIGVDAPAIDHPDDINFSGHLICGEYDMTNTENLCNLDQIVNKRFLYFGLPLRIRDGSGSPIRAVALVEE